MSVLTRPLMSGNEHLSPVRQTVSIAAVDWTIMGALVTNVFDFEAGRLWQLKRCACTDVALCQLLQRYQTMRRTAASSIADLNLRRYLIHQIIQIMIKRIR